MPLGTLRASEDATESTRKGIEMEAQPATLKDVRDFFGMDLKEFRTEWTQLDSESKTLIRQGLGDGTLTY